METTARTRVVWRFPGPEPNGTVEHNIPSDAKLLHVGLKGQPVQVHMWFEVDPNAPGQDRRRFTLVATGLHYEGTYLGTVVHEPSQTVWHLIETTS
jgi:hypothetical protein